MRALIIVPTYNEIENLRSLVEAVLRETPAHVDLLVVDDNSPDGTGKLADTLAAAQSRVHVIHRAKKLGLGAAYVAGFKWGLSPPISTASNSIPLAPYDALIQMDADFSHNPCYLPTMLHELETHEVVIGSRYVEGGGTRNWGVGRKVLSRGGSIYSRMILRAPIRDFTGGFNGWRSGVLRTMDVDTLLSDGYSFQIELKNRAFKLGFKIKEFPIIFEDRKVGTSKMSRRIVFEALSRVWEFRRQPTK